MSEGCSRCVDLEALLQHAGGQLCPQQGAACRLLTESGKNIFCSRAVTDAVLHTADSVKPLSTSFFFFLLSDDFFFLQELFGAVQVSPLSSGYSLGSSNWIIQSHHEKVSYVSGSSLLTTHPQVGQLNTTGPYPDDLRDKTMMFFSQWTKAP